MALYLITEAIIRKHSGRELFNRDCQGCIYAYKLPDSFEKLQELIEKELDIPSESQVIYEIHDRTNKTYRPSVFVTNKNPCSNWLYIIDSRQTASPKQSGYSNSVLLFLKHYERRTGELVYIGTVVINPSRPLKQLENSAPYLKSLMEWTAYDQISPTKLHPLDLNKNCKQLNLGNGDLLIIERGWQHPPLDEEPQFTLLKVYGHKTTLKPIGEYMRTLYQSQQFCDITFVFPNHNNERVSAHRVIISQFDWTSKMFEKEELPLGDIEVIHLSPSVVRTLLDYLYSEAESIELRGDATYLQLYEVALRFKIENVIYLCELKLLSQLSTDNYKEILPVLRHNGSISTLANCDDFVRTYQIVEEGKNEAPSKLLRMSSLINLHG